MWAFKQRGLTDAQFRLLVVLADCHNPARGCFPTQDYLSTECEMSERKVRDTLHALEQRGLISSERRANEYGHRTGTNYILALESLPAKSCKTGKPTGKIASAYRQDYVKPTGNYLPVGIEAEPVKEPVREPVSNPIVPLQVIHGSIVTPFDDFWKAYPKKVSKADAVRAFDKAVRKTSPPEVLAGLERAVRFDQRFKTRQYTPNPATWLNDEGWNDEHPTHDFQSSTGQGRPIAPYLAALEAVAKRRGQ
jgi:hypothetical protein